MDELNLLHRDSRWWHQFSDNKALIPALITLIICHSIDGLLFIRMQHTYVYFTWYYLILIIPILHIIIFSIVSIFKLVLTSDITVEMKNAPHIRLVVIGILDAIVNVFVFFPIGKIESNIYTVVCQMVLLITFVGTKIFRATIFDKVHYVGVYLIFYGVAVQLTYSYELWNDSSYWIITLSIAQFVSSISVLLKQDTMNKYDFDEWYANFWIALFQFVSGVLLSALLITSSFAYPFPSLTSVSDFRQYLTDANNCFLGKTFEISDISSTFCTEGTTLSGSYDMTSNTCSFDCSSDYPPIALFLISIIFNIFYYYLVLFIVRKGSAVLFLVANITCLPIVTLLTTWGFVAGPAQISWQTKDLFSLLIMIPGLLIYSSRPEREQSPIVIHETMTPFEHV